MEDSFKLRVDRIFGSLSSSSTSTAPLTPSLNSLWCLTDDEIERREWIQSKDRSLPEFETSSFFSGKRKVDDNNSLEFPDELEDDLDADVDENPRPNESSNNSAKPDDYGDEEWEIKSSIGLDCTLDYEEEEDEYDKVAVGKEKVADRLYMKDITECGIEINSCNELPSSLMSVTRDPRANHLAAEIRLKEDAEGSKGIGSLHVYKNSAPANIDSEFNATENPKSILKRKDNHGDAKPQKRVRFDTECRSLQDNDTQGSIDISMGLNSSPEEVEVANETIFPSQVPDYIRNPSRYTHYTFDSSNDVDEESNRKAYMDFLQIVKGSETMESQQDDTSVSPPKSIPFIPKKKTSDTIMLENSVVGERNQCGVEKESVQQRGMPIISIAAVDTETDEICSMEEDEPDHRRNGPQKSVRQYRMRAKMLESDGN